MVVDVEKEKQIYLKILDELLDKFELPYTPIIGSNDIIRKNFFNWESSMGEQGIDGYYAPDTDDLVYKSEYFEEFTYPILTFYSDFGDWTFNRGWCRIVLSAEDSNYVLKIPANFLCGRAADFNEAEFEMYQQAVQEGYEDCFAKCFKAGTYRGIPLLMMEKIEVNPAENESISYTTLAKRFNEEYDGDEEMVEEVMESYADGSSETIMAYLTAIYGTEFEEWCQEVGLSDIHSGNFGFENGNTDHPIICDYASF